MREIRLGVGLGFRAEDWVRVKPQAQAYLRNLGNYIHVVGTLLHLLCAILEQIRLVSHEALTNVILTPDDEVLLTLMLMHGLTKQGKVGVRVGI